MVVEIHKSCSPPKSQPCQTTTRIVETLVLLGVSFFISQMRTKMTFTTPLVINPFGLSLWPFLLQLLVIVLLSGRATPRRLKTAESSPVSAILIFGDSTVDPGNNNYISTTFRGNFWPYGKDFVNHVATGRFTNGRLASDFIAQYLGVKDNVPPYLDPTLSTEDHLTGVSFASAGSGFDPLTPTIGNVIPLSEQLEHLREYKGKLEAAIGEDKTKQVLENALFLVSAGTNDFVVNYFTLPIRSMSYSVPSYMGFLHQEARRFLQGLVDQGARRIAVAGLPPIGCLPIVITLYSGNPLGNRDCVGNFSSVAQDYNQKLKSELSSMQQELQPRSGVRISYLDVYTSLQDMTSGHNYGFEVVKSGCCGTGLMEASFLCNWKSPVCTDASKYVFWDSIHPTEESYRLLFQALKPTIDDLIRN